MDLDHALQTAASHTIGVLVTLKRDGRPQLSNVLYHVDGSVIRISLTSRRAKTANLRRDSRASFYVGRQDGWAYLVIEADAELTGIATAPDDAVVEELVELYRSLKGEHPDWDEYRRSMVDDERLVARLRPTRAYGTW